MKLGSLKTWLILILILSFLTPAINAILDFLGVDKSAYEAYLLWGNCKTLKENIREFNKVFF